MEDAEYTPGLVAQILGNKEKKKSSEKSDKRLTSLFAATKLATPLYASPPVLKNQVNKMLSVYHETLERCFLFSIAKSLSSFTVLLNTSANPPPFFFLFASSPLFMWQSGRQHINFPFLQFFWCFMYCLYQQRMMYHELIIIHIYYKRHSASKVGGSSVAQ